MKNVVKEKPTLGAIMGDKTRARANNLSSEQRQNLRSKASIMTMANDARAMANSLNDCQRESALTRGMQLIYGGPQQLTAKTGRA